MADPKDQDQNELAFQHAVETLSAALHVLVRPEAHDPRVIAIACSRLITSNILYIAEIDPGIAREFVDHLGQGIMKLADQIDAKTGAAA